MNTQNVSISELRKMEATLSASLLKLKIGGAAHKRDTARLLEVVEAIAEHSRAIETVQAEQAEIDTGHKVVEEAEVVAVEPALLKEANHCVELAMGIEKQKGVLGTDIIMLGVHCQDSAKLASGYDIEEASKVFNAAMTQAYDAWQEANDGEAVKGGIRNYRSLVNWGLENDELHDEKGVVRKILALAERKRALNNQDAKRAAASPEPVEEVGENGDDETLRAALSAIAELNNIAGEIRKAFAAGDTLAEMKAHFLNEFANDAVDHYKDQIASFASDVDVDTPMAIAV